ncbi:MAG: hypothetical protein ACFE9J_15045, partial [Candidatus Hermodarchaeota archaeon]
MAKDPKKQLNKAEQLYKALQYKRAAKLFNTAGTNFLKLGNYEFAKECFFNAAKSALHEDKYLSGLDSLRNAGNISLLDNNFSEAYQFFKESLNYIPNLRNSSDRNHFFVLFSSLSFLCLFVDGKQEEGLNIIKKIRSEVDDSYFKESALIRLVKDLTVATKDKNEKYVKKIENDFANSKLYEGEANLAKAALVIAKTIVSLTSKLNLDKKLYTTNDVINLTLNIDTKPLLDISENSFYNYKIKELKITKIGVQLTDNFTFHKKLELPIVITPGQAYKINLLIKPHFQMENPSIGPILLTSEL